MRGIREKSLPHVLIHLNVAAWQYSNSK
jgi:hypothetical protein